MNNQIIVSEDRGNATYTYKETPDSQGNHIYYSGPRGNYYTTHLGFFSVLCDLIERGLEFSANFDISKMKAEAEATVVHSREIHEAWTKRHGASQVLI